MSIREHTGFIAWPTLLLAIGTGLVAATTWLLCGVGLMPLWLGFVVMVGVVYVSFTPMHDAAHGSIGGHHSRAWIDELVGWGCSMVFAAPFPAFKMVHLRHHAVVNQDDDPDRWVAGSNPLSIALRCLTIVPHYYVVFLGPLGGTTAANRRARRVVIGVQSLQLLVAAALVYRGFGTELLVLWLIPNLLGSGLLAFGFDWLPHHPHGDQGWWTNARIYDVRLLDVLLLNQNLHLVHHLWPRVPFYRYRRVFHEQRAELEAHGSVVVGSPSYRSPRTTTAADRSTAAS